MYSTLIFDTGAAPLFPQLPLFVNTAVTIVTILAITAMLGMYIAIVAAHWIETGDYQVEEHGRTNHPELPPHSTYDTAEVVHGVSAPVYLRQRLDISWRRTHARCGYTIRAENLGQPNLTDEAPLCPRCIHRRALFPVHRKAS
ncbi:Uncharacterised protein [Mycobacteroides abscessus subsp. abscessus]|uniref:hypothetical protein n=1 Tax=Mycobacteroides abscessus TaxID=36809 RepID=UPI00092AF035|nr:hypothetical protein [Mycobacteroides abscessus]SIJ21475.1 Uncharacterised protein [Mycobacteroides abscessus subsp. abscessus]SLH39009.1 Uncharacterised protein [Mycobacteroides abscessus subsp. abscessus]